MELEQILNLHAVEAPITADFEGRQFAAPDQLVNGGPINPKKGRHLPDSQHLVHRHYGTLAESGRQQQGIAA